MNAGKHKPLNDLLREAAARWRARPCPQLDAPPGFATRVLARARQAPSWELVLWTRLSIGGLAAALLVGVIVTFVSPRPQAAMLENPVSVWLESVL